MTFKRILSVVLSICLCISFFSGVAYAQGEYAAQIGETKYETLEAALAAANATANSTLTLLENVNTTSQLEVSGTFTLDLNGKKIEYTGGALNSGVIMVLRGADLTIADSSGDNSGMIKSGANAYAAIALIKAGETGTDAAKLTVNGGTLEGDYYAITGNGSRHGTQITINGGVIRGAHTNDNLGIYHPQDGTLTITGGELTGYSSAVELRAGTLNVTGGTFTTTATTYSCNPNGSGTTTVGAAIAIAQHTTNKPINATISGANLVVPENSQAVKLSISNPQNNTFENVSVSSDIVPDAVVPAGYQWVGTAGGNYTLQAIPYVAQIGSVKYETLEAAFAAVENGQTITLLADVALTDRLFVNAGAAPAFGNNNRFATTSENKSVTLDLNGYNITTASNIALAGGTLNITGEGTIKTTNAGLAPVEIRGTGDLTAKRTLTIGADVTLEGTDYGLNVFGSNDAQLNKIDVTVNGTVKGTLFVLGNLKHASNEINIIVNGSVIAAPGSASNLNVGIALNGNANVTVNEDAVVSGDSGIEVRCGSLTVNGGTITATAEAFSYTANGSGSTTRGAAIAVAPYGTTIATSAVLNGGTLSGPEMIGVTNVNNDMSNVTVIATAAFTENAVVPAGYQWVGTSGGNYTLQAIPYVAQIGETKYETLKAAVAAADGKTIVLLSDVDLTSDPVTSGGYAVVSPAGTTITLDLNGKAVTGGALDVYGNLTITDSSEGATGSVTGIKHGVWVNEGGSLTLAAGTINAGSGSGVVVDESAFTMTGGTINAAEGNGVAAQNGATFSMTGGTVNADANSSVVVIGSTFTMGGGTVNATADSVNAISVLAGSAVTINNGTVSAPNGYGVVITGNGTADSAALTVNGGVITARDFGISGNGNAENSGTNITITGGTITSTGVDGAGIYQPQDGTLTISGGTISGAAGIYQKCGTLTISGSPSITGSGAAAAYNYNGNGCNPTGDAIVVENCGYPGGAPTATIGGDPEITSTNGVAIGAYFGNTATVIPTITATTNTLTVPAGYEWVSVGENSYTLQAIPYVAQIGSVKYETLEAAFAAVENGQTITLLADVALTDRLFVNAGAAPAFGNNNRFATTSENKSVTLDLNGYNITTASNIALAGGTLNITGEGTIKTTNAGLAPVEIRGTGDLTAKRTLTIGADVTLEGTDYGLNVFGSNDAQLNKIDVTVNGTVKGTLFVLGNLKHASNEINIIVNGSVIAAPGSASNLNVGIALNGNANVTVNEDAVVSGDSGIEVRCGSLTVNGGTITATAEAFSYTANGSGSTTRGAAIAVAPYGTTIATSAVLNGGTLSGPEMIGVTNVNNDMSNVTVTATAAFTQNSVIPTGYEWVSNGNGSYTLQAATTVSATLTLRENININVYVNHIQGTPDQYTVRIYDDPDGQPLVEHSLTDDDLTTWGYKVSSGDIYSFQMSKSYYIDVRKTGAGDEVVILGMYEYSVQAYFDHTYDNANSSAALKALCQAGLYYGRAAQQYFDGKTYSDENGLQNYEVGKPINDERLNNYNPALERPGDTFKPTLTGDYRDLYGVKQISATLELGSETSIVIYVAGETAPPDVTARLKLGENEYADLAEVPVHGSASQTTRAFAVKHIRAYQLADTYTIEISDGSNAVALTYSPYSYARSKWNDSNIGSLVQALVVYGNAARAMGWQ